MIPTVSLKYYLVSTFGLECSADAAFVGNAEFQAGASRNDKSH